MRELTAEEEQACQDHLDAIFDIVGNLKLSTMLTTLKQQMKLTDETERLVLDVIQKTINDSIWSSFAQTAEQLKQIVNDPVKQAEMFAKINELKSSNREGVPTG
jgi:hypothetical protein